MFIYGKYDRSRLPDAVPPSEAAEPGFAETH
jgi:hypothetical protein